LAFSRDKEKRFICRQCGKTFAETKGTVSRRLCTPAAIVTLVVTLLHTVVRFKLSSSLLGSMRGRLCVYIRAIREKFIDVVRTAKRGSPKFRPWISALIAQVLKRSEKRRVAGVERRTVQGSAAQVEKMRRRW
jgi:hypothetical protein